MRQNKGFYSTNLTKFSVNLGGMWPVVVACWSDESHTISCRLLSIQGRKLCLCNFVHQQKVNNFAVGFHFNIYRPNSFKRGAVITTIFDIGLNNLALHPRT